MKKRAQSKIVSILLLISISLILGIILFGLVRGIIKKIDNANIDSARIGLEINSVYISEDNKKSIIEIKRDSFAGEIKGLKFIFEGIDGSYNYDYLINEGIPNPLESKIYEIHSDWIQGLNDFKSINKISVALIEKSNKELVYLKDDYKSNLRDISNNKIFNTPWGNNSINCIPEWECGEWGSCIAIYDLNNIILDEIYLTGIQTRDCVDSNECSINREEIRECNLQIPIILRSVDRCSKEYLEVYDSENNLISRLNKEGNSYLDVQLILDSSTYWPHCFNNIQDCEEEGIDCDSEGIDCAPCI